MRISYEIFLPGWVWTNSLSDDAIRTRRRWWPMGTHTYIPTYIHPCIYPSIHSSMHTSHTYIHVCMHACMHVKHTCVCICICMYIYIYMNIINDSTFQVGDFMEFTQIGQCNFGLFHWSLGDSSSCWECQTLRGRGLCCFAPKWWVAACSLQELHMDYMGGCSVPNRAMRSRQGQSRDHWFAIRKADESGAGAPCEKKTRYETKASPKLGNSHGHLLQSDFLAVEPAAISCFFGSSRGCVRAILPFNCHEIPQRALELNGVLNSC